MTSSVFTPGTRVKTLRSIGFHPAGSVGTVEEISLSLLNGFDCFAALDDCRGEGPQFPGLCFMYSDLEPLS